MQLLMADSMRDHENRVNGTGRRRTMDDNPAFQTRSLYVAPDSEHDTKSSGANRHVRSNPPKTRVEMPANPYERRLRRKTREDRYEPKGNSENEKAPLLAKAIPKKKIIGKRHGNCRIGKRFCAENIRPGRLTANFNENLGIFKKGKTSAPIHCSEIPYLNFSETKFLSKKSQTLPNATEPTVEIQEQKKLDEDEALSSRFKKSLQQPRESNDATLANIHNSCHQNKIQNSPRKEQSHPIDGRSPSPVIPSTGDRCLVVSDAGPSLLNTKTLREIEYSGASIDETLFDSLGNCDQLAVPYEEYRPTFLNGFLYTLEDLKCLCAMRKHSQLGIDVDSIEITTKANLERSFGAEGAYDTLLLGPKFTDVTEDTLLEFLLDIENQSTKDATFGYLERAMNPGELDLSNTGTYSGPNSTYSAKSVLECDLEKWLPLTILDLAHLDQSEELSGEISRLNAATTSDTKTTKQVAAITSSLLDGFSSPDGAFQNPDGQLLSVSAKERRHDKPTHFWAINAPLRLVSQDTNLYQSGLGNVPERRFWRRHKLY